MESTYLAVHTFQGEAPVVFCFRAMKRDQVLQSSLCASNHPNLMNVACNHVIKKEFVVYRLIIIVSGSLRKRSRGRSTYAIEETRWKFD